jgi:deoxyribonuclease-4
MKSSGKGNIHKPRVGVHTSIAGGISKSIERAAALKCSTMQIFSHNPRQWRQISISEEEVERFKILRGKYEINPVYIHASYLINLASLSVEILKKSIEFLAYEMRLADELGAEYVVLHTGSASGMNEREARTTAVKSILKAVDVSKFSASLVLENTAGERGDITSSISALAEIIDMCDCDCIAGICVDTCHAFSAGYDISNNEGTTKLLKEIKKYIGLDKLRLIHLNDSRRPLGSGVDRHEHIGEGFIGISGFKNFLSDKRISNVPMILETPKKTDADDKRNLKKVYNILSSCSAST